MRLIGAEAEVNRAGGLLARQKKRCQSLKSNKVPPGEIARSY